MASASFIVGIIGNIVAIMMFAAPIKTFWWVVKKKSTEEYEGLPYIAALLSTSLWTFYGLIHPDGLLVATVNGTGAAFQIIYIILFVIYAPMDKKIKSLKLVLILNIAFVGTVIAIALPAFHGSQRLTFVGIIGVILAIAMFGAPLSVMRLVIKTRSVEYMPFFLSLFQFITSGTWFAYGVLIKDFYIGVPNGVGFVLASAQLVLYAIYKNKSSHSAKSWKAMEEQSSVQASIEIPNVIGNGEPRSNHGSFIRVTSLPTPPMSPNSSLRHDNDVENGNP